MITALAHILLSFGLAVGAGVACVLAWRQIVDWCARDLDPSNGE